MVWAEDNCNTMVDDDGAVVTVEPGACLVYIST